MEYMRVLLVLVGVLVGSIAARSNRLYSCRTPDGTISSCVKPNSCKSVFAFVQKHGATATVKNFLSKYFCKLDNFGSNGVCCPLSLPNVIPTEDNSSEGHSGHRNIRLLPLDSCGSTHPIDKITQGNETALLEYPWAVALKLEGAFLPYRCGGALINNRYVLTAAHCARGKDKLIGVRLGEHDFNKPIDCDGAGEDQVCAPAPQDFDISDKDIVVHPSYNAATQENDIALIRLPRNAHFNEIGSVAPVCIPITMPEQSHQFKDYTVVGWGRTEDSFASNVLLKLLVPKVENSRCDAVYSKRNIKVTDNHLCAGGKKDQDACWGDSGGPLTADFVHDGLVKTIQYGIVSIGPQVCGTNAVPVVYTKVAKYVGWILDNIRS